MAIILDNVPRFDSRGLPPDMDPDKLFRYRYDTLAKQAVGAESFLYKYIPYNLVKSVAFAIDPLHRFKVAPSTITASNRTRYRSTASVLAYRKLVVTRSYLIWSQESNYHGQSNCSSPYLVYESIPFTPSVSVEETQVPLVDEISDTTSRTRIFGSHQGELELFKNNLYSTGSNRKGRWNIERRYFTAAPNESCTLVGGVPAYELGSNECYSVSVSPSAATLSKSTLDSLQNSETLFCLELSKHYAYRLLKNVSPFNRDYSLSRNVAELKDLPRSMISARRSADDLKKLFTSLSSSPKLRANIFDVTSTNLKNIPSEYLSYHFGWKQLHKDLKDLVELPNKLSKRINLLIARSGKPSTFRSKIGSLSGVGGEGVSGFTYSVCGHDLFTPSLGEGTFSRIERESETRIVLNCTFDFPPINTPQLRRRLLFDKIGLIPRFIDVYNILPWSWLVDWFTGLGNYLELIEEINHDPSLINWGMITSKTRGKLVTEFKCHSNTYTTVRNQLNQVVTDTITPVPYNHTSVLEFEVQTRRNVATVLDVKQSTIPGSLTPYQLSILGAILAQRTGNTRPGDFKPRS